MTLTIALLFLAPLVEGQRTAPAGVPPDALVIEDFEDQRSGALPTGWQWLSGRNRSFEPLQPHMADEKQFRVMQEGGNKFVRASTRSAATRMSVSAEDHGWDLTTLPHLSWRWRAVRLPVGAREDQVNDTGGAVVVTFQRTDFWGRPHSIKYTYSSALPVGQEVSYGNLKVIVVSSGRETTGRWINVSRNVAEDYRRLFGRTPPDLPFSITLWSDSDDTRDAADVDFDDICIHP